MNKKLRKIKISALIVPFIELVIIGVFLILYLSNTWSLKDVIKPEYILYVCFGLILIDTVFEWIMIYNFKKISKTNFVKTADIVGEDTNEVDLFGKVGSMVCDENGIILWVSDLFLLRQMNFVNSNIFDVFPKLKEFNSHLNVSTINIQYQEIDYQVKYLRSSGLFIFKDTSEFENLSRYSKSHALVLGTILIDNYADITLNDEDNNDLILKVRSEIIDYFKQFDVMIRHTKNDTYFAVCTYESLEKMESDRFSILDTVKNCGNGETVIPTLSICFAHEFPDVNKLNENVNNGLQVALARGGDQAIISKFGSELKYYGGKTEAIENKNKVKVRVLSDTLRTLINRAKNVVIMGHTDMDMDALGASLGMKAICDALHKESYIIFESKQTEKKTRSALTSLFSKDELEKIVLSNKAAIDKVNPSTLVIVVDVSRPSITMCPKILELTDKVVVIDHHRRAEDFIYNPVFSYVEPSASSTCEIISEFIKYGSYSNDINLSSTVATIMLSGIFLDTSFYKNKSVGLRAFEGSMILKEYGADNTLAYDLLKDEVEEYEMVNQIVTSMSTFAYGVVYCKANEDEIIDGTMLAKAANKCMELKGINAVFVFGRTSENEIKISARSDGTVNVQILCERFGGGGHLTQAAAVFKNSNMKDVENTLIDCLNDNLANARITNMKGE